MSAVLERYEENLRQATKLETDLAFLLQELSFSNNPPAQKRPASTTTVLAPLYIEQARVLSHNSDLRIKIRAILDSNLFPRGEMIQ